MTTGMMLVGLLLMLFIFPATSYALHNGYLLAGWIGLGAFIISFLIALKGIWGLKKEV